MIPNPVTPPAVDDQTLSENALRRLAANDPFGQATVAVWVDGGEYTDGSSGFAAHLGQRIAGRPLPGITYWRAGARRGRHTLYATRFPVEPDLPADPTITISLTIENTYELYPDVISHVADAVLSSPADDADDAAIEDWGREAFEPFLGVGNERGDSWYDATVTACSNPAMIGLTFSWGY